MDGYIRNPLGKLKNHDGYVRCFARGLDITDGYIRQYPGKSGVLFTFIDLSDLSRRTD